MPDWTCVLELNDRRDTVVGSAADLCDALRMGADLRVGTAFRYNEHIDTSSANRELVREHMDFRETWILDDRWTAGIETLRMPVALPEGFGPRPSMSFFLYNQDGQQAVARPYLDGIAPDATAVRAAPGEGQPMPGMHLISAADEHTNAPSHHFIYAFDYFRYLVCDRWREVLSHDERGTVVSGSFDALIEAVDQGREIKVAIRGLCRDLVSDEDGGPDHEVFVHVGPCYHHTATGFLCGATHPLVRVRPAIPLIYAARAWDFGWLLVRTDGHVAGWLCDPYTLKFNRSELRCAIRWFTDAPGVAGFR